MNLIQLNKQADEINESGLELVLTEQMSVPEMLSRICGVYHKARPFLEVVTKLFFIPKKWRNVILTFMVAMDGLCPK